MKNQNGLVIKFFMNMKKKIIKNSNINLNEEELKNLYCEINDNLDLNIIETFLNNNKANEIKINSDEDEELKSENSDVEMDIDEKNTNNFNIESSLESDSDKLDILVGKDKTYEDNVENYTLSVFDNIIDNIGNLNINNNKIEDNNTLSKKRAKPRKRKKDEDEESSEKTRKKSKDKKYKAYPKYI